MTSQSVRFEPLSGAQINKVHGSISIPKFCRALLGLGPAAVLPLNFMLLGGIYRPRP
jgi:hypothetical protein